MLSKLSIDNYALIDKSNIDFKEGFTVITGETGAGKSIMLDALSLLMGARADSKVMGNKERKMVVEAIFKNPDPAIKEICEENGLEWEEDELILRREISLTGKSRGFVNDTPTNLNVLASISVYLLDIHSQHSNSLLHNSIAQLSIIDAFGNNVELLEDYRKVFKKYIALRNKIKTIKESIIKGKENEEFLRFRLEQLDKLKPKNGELFSLEREAEILGDADKIKSDLTEATNLVDGGQQSILSSLQAVSNLLNNIDFNLLGQEDEDFATRIDSVKIELRDIGNSLETLADRIDSDPVRLEKVQARIDALYEAMKRFKVKEESELVGLHHQLKEELETITGDNSNIKDLEKEQKELAKLLKDKAEILSESRIEASEKFSKALVEKIIPLGLPNINFKVEVKKGKMSADGQDNITFYCSFNKNHPLQPISDIASGGEISRVMLGIKFLISENMHLPTIIFDEIDTGVSGEIAHKMAQLMKGMTPGIQVLAVTHLPQVAASGDMHLKVYKSDNEEKTISYIKELNTDERIREIAGMISGTSINSAAMEIARILLNIK